MTASRNPEDVLASIRRLVAKEVQHAQQREASERPEREDVPVNEKISAAARLVLGPESRVAANGQPASEVRSRPVQTPWMRPPPDSAPAPEPAATDTPPAQPGRPSPSQAAQASSGAAAAPMVADMSEEALRDFIREVLREEVRTRMGARINENIRRIVQEELAQLFAADP